MKKRIAVIPARGGSKRIERKNIKEFLGRPILSYSIAAALESGIFDQVMVSTEDLEIAEISQKYGASVPFLRSMENAGDTATTAAVLLEVLDEYQKNGLAFDELCCIYPAAPFVTPEKLRTAMRRMEEQDADSIIPAAAFSYPPQRCFSVEDGRLKYQWKEFMSARSQDLQPLYQDCGQFYYINVQRFLETGLILMDRTFPLYVSRMETQDIDDETDWKLAELKYRLMTGQA